MAVQFAVWDPGASFSPLYNPYVDHHRKGLATARVNALSRSVAGLWSGPRGQEALSARGMSLRDKIVTHGYLPPGTAFEDVCASGVPLDKLMAACGVLAFCSRCRLRGPRAAEEGRDGAFVGVLDLADLSPTLDAVTFLDTPWGRQITPESARLMGYTWMTLLRHGGFRGERVYQVMSRRPDPVLWIDTLLIDEEVDGEVFFAACDVDRAMVYSIIHGGGAALELELGGPTAPRAHGARPLPAAPSRGHKHTRAAIEELLLGPDTIDL